MRKAIVNKKFVNHEVGDILNLVAIINNDNNDKVYIVFTSGNIYAYYCFDSYDDLFSHISYYDKST